MSEGNAEQREFWERFADVWVTHQEDLDTLMAPVLDRLFARACLEPGQTVLDIGCGTGTSSLRAAEAVGSAGHVTGADISEPMLARARERAGDRARLVFLTVDVADHPFPPEHFERVISRFGVMFFADPVAAFANIRRAMTPGARLDMACWSTLDANPWFRVPMYAAKARLGAPPPLDPDAPGPLAFRDTAHVRGILDRAGFEHIGAATEEIALTPRGTLEEVACQASLIGPGRRAMEHFDATEEDVAAIVATVATGFAGYATPDGLRVPAAINFFTAVAPRR